jgi:hypothetical protein
MNDSTSQHSEIKQGGVSRLSEAKMGQFLGTGATGAMPRRALSR